MLLIVQAQSWRACCLWWCIIFRQCKVRWVRTSLFAIMRQVQHINVNSTQMSKEYYAYQYRVVLRKTSALHVQNKIQKNAFKPFAMEIGNPTLQTCNTDFATGVQNGLWLQLTVNNTIRLRIDGWEARKQKDVIEITDLLCNGWSS